MDLNCYILLTSEFHIRNDNFLTNDSHIGWISEQRFVPFFLCDQSEETDRIAHYGIEFSLISSRDQQSPNTVDELRQILFELFVVLLSIHCYIVADLRSELLQQSSFFIILQMD
jgi:hypothetical protein